MLNVPQPDIPSASWPSDRKFLTVREVAAQWRVTDRHVVNLIEEGRLVAFDIAGRNDYVRVPMTAVEEISRHMKVPSAAVLTIINAAKPQIVGSRRAFWRVPVAEGVTAFMRENHSLNLI